MKIELTDEKIERMAAAIKQHRKIDGLKCAQVATNYQKPDGGHFHSMRGLLDGWALDAPAVGDAIAQHEAACLKEGDKLLAKIQRIIRDIADGKDGQ